jgi:hypothetical protein
MAPFAWEDAVMDDQRDDQPLVKIYSAPSGFDGELTKGRLEAEGIPVMLKGEAEGPYRAGPVYLWVPADQEEAARKVLDAIASGAYELEDDSEA